MYLGFRPFENVERQSLSCFGANPWKSLKLFDEAG
jgi:hypothetical protein